MCIRLCNNSNFWTITPILAVLFKLFRLKQSGKNVWFIYFRLNICRVSMEDYSGDYLKILENKKTSKSIENT